MTLLQCLRDCSKRLRVVPSEVVNFMQCDYCRYRYKSKYKGAEGGRERSSGPAGSNQLIEGWGRGTVQHPRAERGSGLSVIEYKGTRGL